MTTRIQDPAVSIPIHPPSRLSNWSDSILQFARKQPLGAACALILVALVLVALFAPMIAPYPATKNDVGPSLSGPSSEHWFGTDQFGRDLFSRVVYGARISLYVGLVTTLIGVVLATLLGAASGYFGGVFDYFVQRFVDAAQAIPPLVLLIGVLVVLGPSVQNVIIALSLRNALSLSRVTRGAVIGVRSNQYIEAVRAIGASHGRTLWLHVLPNILPAVVVLISTSIGANIVAEASLSFLGYGVPPPTPTWGGMMSAEGRIYMLASPWILVFPTIALSLVVFAMNMFGDALRDEIDPRMRGSR